MGNAMWRTGELQRKVGFNPPCLRITRTDMTPAPILARRSALAADSVRGGRPATAFRRAMLRATGKRNAQLQAAALHLSDRLAAASDPQARKLGLAAARELRAPSAKIRGRPPKSGSDH